MTFRHTTLRSLLAVLAILPCLGTGTVVAADPPIVLEAAALSRETAGAADAVARVRDLARSGQAGQAVAMARATLDDPGVGQATRERVRYETLLALAAVDAEPTATAFVREAKDMAPTVYVRLDESGHEIVVPAWDARAAARFTERRWREREAAEATRTLLAGRGDLAAAWLRGDADARSGILEGLRAAPVGQMAAAAASLSPDLSASTDLAVPALLVAARTSDADLFARALLAGPAADASRSLRDDLGSFGPTQRVEILSAALERPDLASAALLALAAEAPTQPRAEALLWSRLASPADGASAAAALARLDDGAVALQLEALATGSRDPVTARWARLALDLRASQASGGRR